MGVTTDKMTRSNSAPWSGERVLWRSRPGPHVVVPPVLAGMLLAGGGLWLPGAVTLPVGWVPLVLVPIGMLLACTWGLYAWRTVYVVTETRLYRRTGLTHARLTEVPLSSVNAVGHVRSGLDAVFDAGTVEVSVRDEEGRTVHVAMKHTRRPGHLDDLLTELCLDLKTPMTDTAVPTRGPDDRDMRTGPGTEDTTTNEAAAPERDPTAGDKHALGDHASPGDDRTVSGAGSRVESTETAPPGRNSKDTVTPPRSSKRPATDGTRTVQAKQDGDPRREQPAATADDEIEVRVVDVNGVVLLRPRDEDAIPGVSSGDDVRLSLRSPREDD